MVGGVMVMLTLKLVKDDTNLLGRERLHVGVGTVGYGGVRVRDRLQGLCVALDDARRQQDLGGLRLDLVGAVDVVVALEEHQLLLPLRDLSAKEFNVTIRSIRALPFILPGEHLDGLAQHHLHVDHGLCAGRQRGLELHLPRGCILGGNFDILVPLLCK